MIYGSRSYNLDVTEGLVPISDMLNTDKVSKLNVGWTYIKNFDGKEGFIMKAIKNIKRGEEFLIQYGYKSSYNFYMNYGFILNDEFGTNQK